MIKRIVFISILVLTNNIAQNNCNYPDQNNDVFISSSYHMSENSIFVNPLNPNIILNANNAMKNGFYGYISTFISTDGGMSWNGGYLLENIFERPKVDPAAVIDLYGRMYVGYMEISSNGQSVAWSNDNGLNWNPVRIPLTQLTDRNHLWVDNSCLSSWQGRIYSSWTYNDNKWVQFSKSTDHGLSWSNPVNLDINNNLNYGVNISTNKYGHVFIAWPIYIGQFKKNFDLAVSLNGGDTWVVRNNILEDGLVNSKGGGPIISFNFVTNRMFLVWDQEYYTIGESGIEITETDIKVIYSDNSGVTWSEPITVNQNITGKQWLPWIACDQMTGYISVIYYDQRNGLNTYVSISTNNGLNWCDLKVSDSENIQEYLDYIGIAFHKGKMYPCWTKNVSGNARTIVSLNQLFSSDLIVYPPINQSNYFAINSISTNGVFPYQQINSNFIAGNYVDLKDGFIVSEGSNFVASVANCAQIIPFDENNSNNYTSTFYEYKKRKLESSSLFNLYQNYPNPFNPMTTIKYSLKSNSKVKLAIYDLLGKEIVVLVDKMQDSGFKSVVWDGKNKNGNNVSSGIYIYSIKVGDFVDTKKMLLLK